jgi:hypothetical protein
MKKTFIIAIFAIATLLFGFIGKAGAEVGVFVEITGEDPGIQFANTPNVCIKAFASHGETNFRTIEFVTKFGGCARGSRNISGYASKNNSGDLFIYAANRLFVKEAAASAAAAPAPAPKKKSFLKKALPWVILAGAVYVAKKNGGGYSRRGDDHRNRRDGQYGGHNNGQHGGYSNNRGNDHSDYYDPNRNDLGSFNFCVENSPYRYEEAVRQCHRE